MLDPERDALLHEEPAPPRLGAQAAQFAWFLLLWGLYAATMQRSKRQSLENRRKLRGYVDRLDAIIAVNNREMARCVRLYEMHDKHDQQNMHSFRVRALRHESTLRSQSLQQGKERFTFTQAQLRGLLTADDMDLESRSVIVQSNKAREAKRVAMLRNLSTVYRGKRGEVGNMLEHMETKEHLGQLAHMLQGVDGVKITELGEKCAAHVDAFLAGMQSDLDAVQPPAQGGALRVPAAHAKGEADLWARVFETGVIVEQEQAANEPRLARLAAELV